uniref:MALT paracaspase 2 n=1 Tax=Echeneis naucrates TaxID=173247 RepID=A0A665VG12_ECHNA
SLQVLSAAGSPGRTLLALLADRSCPLDFLIHAFCLLYFMSGSLLAGETIRITMQPQSQQATMGSRVVLTCRATGPPGLCYQWFRGREEVSPTSHHYVIVNNKVRFQLCAVALVNFILSGCSSLFPGSASGLRIICQPQSQTLSEGNSLTMECKAEANPPAQYRWYSNMVEMPEHKTNLLKVSVLTVAATDKVALLIGNMNYLYHNQLCAPIADVHELANLLRQMDFKVVSLLDLNCQEMHSAVTEFLMLLDKGVYGLLYFAGHGYENYGNSFMVPIDAPASYTSEHCLCVQNILTRMQQKETGLNVFLLDMCRKRNPNDDVIVRPGLLKVTANIVFGYATCVDAEAYEVKESNDVSNGIFINFLKKRICEDEKVTVMLDRVAEDMGHCVITRGRQALELRSNLSERRSLTDQIQDAECSASFSARNLQWAVAHVLPKSKYLQFDCGVTVQLGFAAEFSNVMVIYTRILEKPKEIVSCSAQLTDFPQDVEINLKKSNQETLPEAGCLLLFSENLSSPEVPRLYTRICSLQRLRRELTFTVCLHYTYCNMDEEVEERKPVTVGKPLVSKLNLHEPQQPPVCSASASSSFSPDPFDVPECSYFSEGFPSVESDTSHTPLYDAQAGRESPVSMGSSRSTNIPEETDSPDYFDHPTPLVGRKSLPHSQVHDTNYKFSDMYNLHFH